MKFRLKREDGQVSLAVLLLSVLVIAAAVGAFIYGEANDSRTRAQKGADAAALAAARDVRERFIPAFALAHIPPPPVAGPAVPANPIMVLTPLGEVGRHGAFTFAQKNESQLSRYMATGNRFEANVQSKKREVGSPVGSRARKKISAPGDAVAKIKTEGVYCHSTDVHRVKGQVMTWAMVCSGNGHSARVNYFGPTTTLNDVESHKKEWRRVFDIKLDK